MHFFESTRVAAAISLILLSGCSGHLPSSHPNFDTQQDDPLQAHHWTLAKILTNENKENNHWVTENKVEIDFNSVNIFHIKSLCNAINGHYRADIKNINISHLSTTLVACQDENISSFEEMLRHTLPLASQWKVEHSSLELSFLNGDRWILQGKVKYPILYGPSTRIFLEIAPQTAKCHLASMRDAQCLQVRTIEYNISGIKTHKGAWNSFTETIHGYTHQEGYRTIVRLDRYNLNKSNASDAQDYLYVHDMTVETGKEP